MTVNKVNPITKAFKNKSVAPLRYFAERITLTKKHVRTISAQNASSPPCLIPLSNVASSFGYGGAK
jgi:hypothetical protein